MHQKILLSFPPLNLTLEHELKVLMFWNLGFNDCLIVCVCSIRSRIVHPRTSPLHAKGCKSQAYEYFEAGFIHIKKHIERWQILSTRHIYQINTKIIVRILIQRSFMFGATSLWSRCIDYKDTSLDFWYTTTLHRRNTYHALFLDSVM